MIGASWRPSGRFPVVIAVAICSSVQAPIPVSLSGVMFRPLNSTEARNFEAHVRAPEIFGHVRLAQEESGRMTVVTAGDHDEVFAAVDL